MQTVMITGANGFIGKHLIERIIETTDWHIAAVDREFTGAFNPRVSRFAADLTAWPAEDMPAADVVFSVASHVDVAGSLANPRATIENNTGIANTLVDYARTQDTPPKIVHVTTAEVFGPGDARGAYEPARPTNPYAASKAAQDAIFHAAASCYGIPLVTARTANVFGEHQAPEKFVPTIIRNLKAGDTIDLYGNAWRRWIYANDLADNLIALAQAPATTANITGAHLQRNIDFARTIASRLSIAATFNRMDEQRPGHEHIYDLAPHNMPIPDDLETGVARMVAA